MKSNWNTILPWVTLAHTLFFVIYWLSNSLFGISTNGYLAGAFKAKLDYVTLLVVIAAAVGLWSLGRILAGFFHFSAPLETLGAWVFSIIAVLFILLFYASFGLLFYESPVQLDRLLQMIGYFRILIDPLLLLGAAALIGWAIKTLHLNQSPVVWGMLAGALILFALWEIPMYVLPGSIYRGTLPAKPKLIAHRGASMLAPENTVASAELAASFGVYGLETDIHISQDGVLYLMHDPKLYRTTNVSEVFPERENEKAESFTWAEVKQLTAGAWFVKSDPYQAILSGRVTTAQAASFSTEKVPTLAQELAIVKKNNLHFIYDLNQPPAGNPKHNSYFADCLDEIHQAEVDALVWVLAEPGQLADLTVKYPSMMPAKGLDYQQPFSAATLVSQGYKIVNTEYGLSADWIHNYQGNGLWVNVYTIDESWQFSRLWLLGVDSTTTSNSKVMADLQQPIMGLPYDTYVWIWGLVGVAALALGYFLGYRW
jgi:glycerophosphoryl diester phosphodiesterase